jgi:hypothetical protein
MRQWVTVLLAVVWFLWGQDEHFWSYKLLNIIPGPTRGYPYIIGEFEDRSDCSVALLKSVKAQTEMWNLPEMQAEIKKFGGLWSATSYACVPAPFKPERIEPSGWK